MNDTHPQTMDGNNEWRFVLNTWIKAEKKWRKGKCDANKENSIHADKALKDAIVTKKKERKEKEWKDEPKFLKYVFSEFGRRRKVISLRLSLLLSFLVFLSFCRSFFILSRFLFFFSFFSSYLSFYMMSFDVMMFTWWLSLSLTFFFAILSFYLSFFYC